MKWPWQAPQCGNLPLGENPRPCLRRNCSIMRLRLYNKPPHSGSQLGRCHAPWPTGGGRTPAAEARRSRWGRDHPPWGWCRPQRGRGASFGEGVIPFGEGVVSSGEGVVPVGDGAIPGGEGALPCGDGVIPFGDEAIPEGDGTFPDGWRAHSSGTGSSPMGKVSSPKGTVPSPAVSAAGERRQAGAQG